MDPHFKFILLIIYITLTCQNQDNEQLGAERKHNVHRKKLLSMFAKDEDDVADFVSEELLYIVLVVSIVGSYSVFCTGCLIADNLVLTTASCLTSKNGRLPDAEAVGVYERPLANLLEVLRITVNPNFYSRDRRVATAHDFAVMEVERSEQTEFPTIPQQAIDFPDIKNICVMGGYGGDGRVSISSFNRIFINKTTVDDEYGRSCFGGRHLCLHFREISLCEEDRGAPIVCGGELYAVFAPMIPVPVSQTSKCFTRWLSTFSPVHPVGNWLEKIISEPTFRFVWLSNPWWVLLLCFVVFCVMGIIYYGLVEALQRKLDPISHLERERHARAAEAEGESVRRGTSLSS